MTGSFNLLWTLLLTGSLFSGSRPTTAKKMTSNAITNLPPISNVTKQSFHKASVDDTSVPRVSGQVPPRQQPLLYKRQQETDSAQSGVYTSQETVILHIEKI